MEHLLEGNNTLDAYCIRATTASQDEQRLIVNHNLVRKDFKWIIYFGMKTLNGGFWHIVPSSVQGEGKAASRC